MTSEGVIGVAEALDVVIRALRSTTERLPNDRARLAFLGLLLSLIEAEAEQFHEALPAELQ